jgi:hypothetical protein
MPTATIDLPAAGYRFIPAVFQYSAGVAALPGFRIERVRFAEPIALAEGWRRIAALLEVAGRPRTAFCACELRSPAPFTVVAGSGEAEEGHANYRDHITARGDLSPAGLRAKARFVLGEMERRMAALGADWHATTAVQAYTVHDPHPFLAAEIVARGAARHGLTWQFCRPPVVELEFEMDCRGVPVEWVVGVPA